MEGYANIREITNKALEKNYQVIGFSASSPEKTRQLVEAQNLNFKFYFCDETTLKTIVRSNPGILELHKGTITQKLHWNDALALQLKQLPPRPKVEEIVVEEVQDSTQVVTDTVQ